MARRLPNTLHSYHPLLLLRVQCLAKTHAPSHQDLEERQRELAEQGESMSDTRPVARLAAACQELRGELAQMELRCGVLQATLLSPANAT